MHAGKLGVCRLVNSPSFVTYQSQHYVLIILDLCKSFEVARGSEKRIHMRVTSVQVGARPI